LRLLRDARRDGAARRFRDDLALQVGHPDRAARRLQVGIVAARHGDTIAHFQLVAVPPVEPAATVVAFLAAHGHVAALLLEVHLEAPGVFLVVGLAVALLRGSGGAFFVSSFRALRPLHRTLLQRRGGDL
jgi:hypothetical protein